MLAVPALRTWACGRPGGRLELTLDDDGGRLLSSCRGPRHGRSVGWSRTTGVPPGTLRLEDEGACGALAEMCSTLSSRSFPAAAPLRRPASAPDGELRLGLSEAGHVRG